MLKGIIFISLFTIDLLFIARISLNTNKLIYIMDFSKINISRSIRIIV